MNQGLAKAQFAHPVDRLVHFPNLVRVDHQLAIRADHLARNAHAADVVLQVRAHLQLHVIEAGVDRLAAEPAQLVVAVAEPAGRGGVAGIALAFERGDPLGLAGRLLAQQFQRVRLAQAVAEITEVDGAHQLFRRHVGHQAPQGLAFGLGPQVPGGVDHRAGGQVDGALVRADPAQLAVRGHVAPEAAHVLADPVQVEAHHQVAHRLDRRAADLVAAADREGQPVPFQAVAIGFENHVGSRVIGIGVHRIGTVALLRGRKTHVEDAHRTNDRHGRMS